MQSVDIRQTKSTHEPYALMLSSCCSIANDDRPAHHTRDSTVENLRHARVAATRRLRQRDGPHFTETLISQVHLFRPPKKNPLLLLGAQFSVLFALISSSSKTTLLYSYPGNRSRHTIATNSNSNSTMRFNSSAPPRQLS